MATWVRFHIARSTSYSLDPQRLPSSVRRRSIERAPILTQTQDPREHEHVTLPTDYVLAPLPTESLAKKSSKEALRSLSIRPARGLPALVPDESLRWFHASPNDWLFVNASKGRDRIELTEGARCVAVSAGGESFDLSIRSLDNGPTCYGPHATRPPSRKPPTPGGKEQLSKKVSLMGFTRRSRAGTKDSDGDSHTSGGEYEEADEVMAENIASPRLLKKTGSARRMRGASAGSVGSIGSGRSSNLSSTLWTGSAGGSTLSSMMPATARAVDRARCEVFAVRRVDGEVRGEESIILSECEPIYEVVLKEGAKVEIRYEGARFWLLTSTLPSAVGVFGSPGGGGVATTSSVYYTRTLGSLGPRMGRCDVLLSTTGGVSDGRHKGLERVLSDGEGGGEGEGSVKLTSFMYAHSRAEAIQVKSPNNDAPSDRSHPNDGRYRALALEVVTFAKGGGHSQGQRRNLATPRTKTHTIELSDPGSRATVGRKGADVLVNDAALECSHATVESAGGAHVLTTSLGEKPTYLCVGSADRRRISVPLSRGVSILVGRTELLVVYVCNSLPPATSKTNARSSTLSKRLSKKFSSSSLTRREFHTSSSLDASAFGTPNTMTFPAASPPAVYFTNNVPKPHRAEVSDSQLSLKAIKKRFPDLLVDSPCILLLARSGPKKNVVFDLRFPSFADGADVLVGSDPVVCQVSCAADQKLDPVHGRLVFNKAMPGFVYEDLSSTGGSWQRLGEEASVALRCGDCFKLSKNTTMEVFGSPVWPMGMTGAEVDEGAAAGCVLS